MKKFLKTLIFCSIFLLGIKNVYAMEYTISPLTSNTDIILALESFKETYTNWNDKNWIKEKAEILSNTYLSNYTNKMVFLEWTTNTNGYFNYGNISNYSPAFLFIGWNGSQDLYYHTYDGYIDKQINIEYGTNKNLLYDLATYKKMAIISPTGDIIGNFNNISIWNPYNFNIFGNVSSSNKTIGTYEVLPFGGYNTLVYYDVGNVDKLKANPNNVDTFILPTGKIIGSNGNDLMFKDMISPYWIDVFGELIEPSYTYTSQILENGNVKLTFNFSNYSESNYAFSLYDNANNIEYGVENTFDDIFPKIISFDDTYSVEVLPNALLELTLNKYNEVPNTSLYLIDEISSDLIDIDNLSFNNSNSPYFTITSLVPGNLVGNFNNTTQNDSCFYHTEGLSEWQSVSCTNTFDLEITKNGIIQIFITRENGLNNSTIYERHINVYGTNTDIPKINYNLEKKENYTIVKFSLDKPNYDINTNYRYSIDGGRTYTEWILTDSTNDYSFSVFDNTKVIIMISNRNHSTVYDYKSINIINDPAFMQDINNTNSNGDITLSTLNNFAGILPQGPIDSILNLPITMFNSLNNALNGTCNNISITLPYVNEDIQLGCINNFYESIGATDFANWAGVIASTFMLFSYFIYVYNWLDNITSLGHNKLKVWGGY